MAQHIAITTAQNVVLDYNLANLGDRILAYLIDSLIKGAYSLLLFAIAVPSLSGGFSPAMYFILFLVVLPIVFYTLFFEIYTNGQTPGKKAMNIKVVHLDGHQVNLASYVLRWLFRIVDIMLMSGIIGIIAIAMSEKGQRIGDIVANTTVISTKKKTQFSEVSFEQIIEDYQPVYSAASQLRAEDIETVKEVLKLRDEDAFMIKKQLAEKLEKVLEIQKSGSSEDFLNQIIKDYNHFQQAV